MNQSFSIIKPFHSSGCLPIEMIWIPPTNFMMGTYIDDEEWKSGDYDQEYVKNKEFEVTFQEGFWVSKNNITNFQWHHIMKDHITSSKEHDLPKISISWQDCIEFCDTLTHSLIQKIPKGYIFNLPTEAQWEYICKIGNQQFEPRLSNDSMYKQEFAWTRENSNNKLQKVGQKKSNSLGFNDLLGNCMEWCFDYLNDYPTKPTINWIGKEEYGFKIIRGCCYFSINSDEVFDCSFRLYEEPHEQLPNVGFRLALWKNDLKRY